MSRFIRAFSEQIRLDLSGRICYAPASHRAEHARAIRRIFFGSQTGTKISSVRLLIFLIHLQFLAAKSYDYHPPLPMPDAEAPQKSYGDCAICMDSIAVPVDLSRRKQVQFDTTAGIMNAVQMGVNASGLGGRKSYSLAPCHHLFVSDSNCCIHII